MSASINPTSAPRPGDLYPIRTVATMTGVNAVTLRAWERRYGLVKPKRSPKGHRFYSADDVAVINRIVSMLERGLPVSRVHAALACGGGEAVAGPWEHARQRMLRAIARFDEEILEDTYNGALQLYPVSTVTRELVIPLLEMLGKRWCSAEAGVAEEHFFTLYLRNKLGARFHHRRPRNTGPSLLVACLPGERHELGLLLWALSAHEHGFRLVLLGADTPLSALPAAARRAAADAVVLAGSVGPADVVLEAELPALVKEIAMPVFVGGRVALKNPEALRRAGALPLSDDIEHGLRRIEEAIA